MNPNETISDAETNRLLQEAAMRDQRTIGATDIAAWYTDLNVAGIGYDDALAAVSRYYSVHWPKQPPAQRFRLTAPVLIELVREIRERRHQAANFIYEPDPDETGAEFVQRLRTQQRAVGDGYAPAHSTAELSPRPVAALIAGVAQAMPLPPEINDILAPRRTGPKSIRCPKCSAGPATRCTNDNGKPMSAPHPSRVDAHAVQTADCPECYATAGDGCREMGEPYRGGAHPGRVKAAADLATRTEGA